MCVCAMGDVLLLDSCCHSQFARPPHLLCSWMPLAPHRHYQVKAAALGETKSKVTEAIRELVEASAAAEPELDAMVFLLQQGRKKEKAITKSERYRRVRLGNRFIPGGVGQKFAPVLANALCNAMKGEDSQALLADPPAGSFDLQRVCKLTSGSDLGKDFHEVMAGLRPNIDVKQDYLSKFLKETSTPGGAVMRLECEVAALEAMFASAGGKELSDKGHLPWVVAVRTHSWRHGPSSYPMPGYGAFIDIFGDKPDLCLAFMPISAIVNKGVSVADLRAFLETETGQGEFTSKAVVIHATPKAIYWCPYGWLCLPFAMGRFVLQENGDGKGEVPDIKDDSVAVMTVTTVFSFDAAASVPNQVWAAVRALNDSHVEKCAHKASWVARAALTKMLQDQLNTAASSST